MKFTGGGKFNPENKHLYFIAATINDADIVNQNKLTKNVLIPLNEISEKSAIQLMNMEHLNLYIDSGIYNLASSTAKKRNISFTQALKLQPEELDNFEKFYKDYVAKIKLMQDKIWGYVELDIGGEKTKTKLRAKLENEGLFPIPVWHPFTDSFQYYKDLVEEYDRVCLGNLSYANNQQRMRILLRVLEHRKETGKPQWIHALGMTPNVALYSLPVESCDSSAWVSARKFGQLNASGGAENFGELGREFLYRKKEPYAYVKAIKYASYDVSFIERNWQNYYQEVNFEKGSL